MALENFCEQIVKLTTVDEALEKLQEYELSVLQSRDEHGNTLLHLAVKSNCSVAVFQSILSVTNLAVRNDDFMLAQDLLRDRELEKPYMDEIISFIEEKLCNAEGIWLRDLIVSGWDHRPYLELAIGNLVEKLNDNLGLFLGSVNRLVEDVQIVSSEIVNETIISWDSRIVPEDEIKDVLYFHNEIGLTILHVAVLYEKYGLLDSMLTCYSQHGSRKATDHMDRTALHYIYSLPLSAERNRLIDKLKQDPLYNCVDICGNSPEYYEYFPELLKINKCKAFIDSELIETAHHKLVSPPGTHTHADTSVSSGDVTADSGYLQQSVGRILTKALADVVEKRPIDPIEYLGKLLKFYVTNIDNSRYKFKKNKVVECNDAKETAVLVPIVYSFEAKIFSPFLQAPRDENGTPLGYKVLLKKLRQIDNDDIDWFEIFKRGLNFALRDSGGKTLIDLALEAGYSDVADDLNSIVLNLINEENFECLKNLFSLGFWPSFPDIYDLCGPDLFDVPRSVEELFKRFSVIYDQLQDLFEPLTDAETVDIKYDEVISEPMIAFAYNSHGLTLIHRAIVDANLPLFLFLVERFPDTIKLKDCFNRNVCHYSVAYPNDIIEETIDAQYPDGKEELDCFDYLPEYYEFYRSAFRNL